MHDKLAATVTEAVQRALKVKLYFYCIILLFIHYYFYFVYFIISKFQPEPSLAPVASTHLLFPPTPTAHKQAEAKEGEALVDVTVIAHAVEKVDYYENGEHF